MAKRSHEEWVDLIIQQPASGLTIMAFCRQHKLPFSSFYARKSNMSKTKTVTPFVKATVATSTAMTLQAQPCHPQQLSCLQYQTGLWTFPCSLPASCLLDIIKGLQAC